MCYLLKNSYTTHTINLQTPAAARILVILKTLVAPQVKSRVLKALIGRLSSTTSTSMDHLKRYPNSGMTVYHLGGGDNQANLQRKLLQIRYWIMTSAGSYLGCSGWSDPWS